LPEFAVKNSLSNRRSIVEFTAVVSLLAMPALTSAQGRSESATAQARSQEALDEVVVTARRREESGQSVPITINSLSAEALTSASVRGLTDVTQLVPGFRATPVGPDINTDFTMRGLARSPGGDGSPAVVTYFAEVPLSQDGTLVPAYDLANLQVLKGPQGTLFGRNAIGGAVLITPQPPQHEWGGYVRGAYGDLDYQLLEGAVNVPLISKRLALRLSGQSERQDSYATNLLNGSGAGDIHRDSIRVSLLLEPLPNLRNTLTYDHMDVDEAGRPMIALELLSDPATGVSPIGLVSFPFFNCGTIDCDINLQLERQKQIGVRKFYSNVPLISEAKLSGVVNKTEVELGGIQLTNIFGYRSTEIFTEVGAGLALSPQLLDSAAYIDVDQYSDELQIQGNAFDDQLTWIFGGFYLEYNPDRATRTEVIAPANWLPTIGERTNRAVFGQISYDISKWVDGLSVDVGWRYNKDRQDLCSLPTTQTPDIRTPNFDKGQCTSSVAYRGKESTWTAGLSYKWKPDVTTYITARRGYREGGINSPSFSAPEQALFVPFQSYDPELLTDVEVGLKSDWQLGSVRGRFNLALFTQRLEGYQQNIFVGGLVPPQFAPSNSSLTINSGELEMSGADAALALRPIDDLTITANVSYFSLDSADFAVPAALNPGGASIPATTPTPEWSTNIALQYVLPIRPGAGELTLNVNYYWSDEVTYEALTLPSYDLTDLRLDWKNPDLGLNVGLFMRNAFDDENMVSAHIFQSTFGLAAAAFGPPRIYGLELTYEF
jgi:iron complex outermembrane recepter protein